MVWDRDGFFAISVALVDTPQRRCCMQYDEHLWPQEVSVGEVIYPPGGTLGPRYQKTLQLVLLYSGHTCLWVDGTMREAASRSVCILLPEHEEYFAFDTR